MKRFLCLLVTLLLVGSFGLAEAIDLSSMTDEELLALKEQVNQAVSDRGLIKEFQLTSGIYIGGVDIKPGRYTLIATDANDMVSIGLGVDTDALDSDKGILFMDTEYFHEGDEPKTYSLSIAEGNVLVIKAKGSMTIEKAEIIG